MEQVFGALQRVFQGLVRLIGVRRPLHRNAAFGFAGMGEAIRVNLRLNIAIAGIEIGRIEPEYATQSE